MCGGFDYSFCVDEKMSCFQSLGYAQFLAIASCNLWNGVRIKYSSIEIVLFLLSMLCVGVVEEIIFRGSLFKAL